MYIHGLHEPGGEHLMEDKPGWILFLHEIGHSGQANGFDYTPWTNRGFNVIARVNHGYGRAGTIPTKDKYIAFAQTFENFVRNSRGCTRFIVGNEPNHENEWPDGIPITAADYALCYTLVRNAVHQWDANIEIVVAAPAPWYPPDWMAYYREMLLEINRRGSADAIALHAYTHGYQPTLITSNQKTATPPGQYYHFRTYIDGISCQTNTQKMAEIPVYITEMDQYDAWLNQNNGWIQEAYREIDRWNQDNRQKILCGICYRWPRHDKWFMQGLGGVEEDFRQAAQMGLKVPETNDPIQEIIRKIEVALNREALAIANTAKAHQEVASLFDELKDALD